MKQAILKFASSLMSKEQMKTIKGGDLYCVCNGNTGNPQYNYCPNIPCSQFCSGTYWCH